MGGDHAPGEIVQGALDAAREFGLGIILVGDEAQLQAEVRKRGGVPDGVIIHHAADVITAHEPPVQAVRRKKDSSLVVAMRLVKEGEADAFLSAGSTGALLAAGLFVLGRMPGVERPALGTAFPTRSGKPVLILDIGANVDNRPEHLVQFALMGRIYSQAVLGRENPRVALLNNGTEAEKGNELTKATYPLLAGLADLNFAGHIEAREVPAGDVDVVVCDGFVGNVVLKLYEGVALTLFDMIKQALTSTVTAKLGALLARPALRQMARKVDWTETGGAPLLGLKAPVIKCHGSSNAKAIRSGLRVTRDLVAAGAVARMEGAIQAAGAARAR